MRMFFSRSPVLTRAWFGAAGADPADVRQRNAARASRLHRRRPRRVLRRSETSPERCVMSVMLLRLTLGMGSQATCARAQGRRAACRRCPCTRRCVRASASASARASTSASVKARGRLRAVPRVLCCVHARCNGDVRSCVVRRCSSHRRGHRHNDNDSDIDRDGRMAVSDPMYSGQDRRAMYVGNAVEADLLVADTTFAA
eukprot:3062037-Rhodomonas_salina.1